MNDSEPVIPFGAADWVVENESLAMPPWLATEQGTTRDISPSHVCNDPPDAATAHWIFCLRHS
jgi:hypothetical protein